MISFSEFALPLNATAWLTAKVTIVLAAGVLCTSLMWRTSASARHLVLALSVCGALMVTAATPIVARFGIALPISNALVSSPAVLRPPAIMQSTEAGTDGGPTQHTTTSATPTDAGSVKRPAVTSAVVSLGTTALIVWAFGAMMMALWFVIGHARLARLKRGAHEVAESDRITLLGARTPAIGTRRVALVETKQVTGPLTFGWRTPSIVLPAGWRDWPEATRSHVVLHEFAHVSRNDWLVQQLGALMCTVYWFHPVVWYAWRRMRAEAERACDDAVLSAALDGPEYAASLVRVATLASPLRFAGAAGTAMARTSTLEQRVRAILDTHVSRAAISPARRRMAVAIATAALLPLAALSRAAWSVDAQPMVVLGEDGNDTTQLFAEVVGATRLPNGNVLVAERISDMWLHEFGPNGRHTRSFARSGQGPEEIGMISRLMRCGDSIVTWGGRASGGHVFGLDGRHARRFTFGSPQPAYPPCTTACNGSMVFLHHGWEQRGSDRRLGVFRVNVPYWLSGADSAIRVLLGEFAGSERLGYGEGNVLRTTGPLPFGKQPAVAVGRDRVYIGLADRFEILAFDFSGRRLASIVKPDEASEPVSPADLNDWKTKELATTRPEMRARVEQYHTQIPRTLHFPAYRSLRVDSEGLLWVERYPRARLAKTTWWVFDPTGTQVATLTMPRDLEVFEIGRDYVLGRYLDADEGIPQVHMYRLSRR